MTSDPWPDAPPGSRLAEVNRRTFLLRSAGLVGLAAVGGLAACSGNDDANAFKSTASSTNPSSTTATTASTSMPSAASASASAAAPGAPLAVGAQLGVTFTYAPSASGGRVNNPYVAVWIEDAGSTLVKALAVWYKTGKDAHYLSELTSWTATDGSSSAVNTVSGATRTPGAYRLSWDGTDEAGDRAPVGDYFVAIESAREHGPHSLIRQSITLGDRALKADLTSNGELTDASVDYHIA